MTDTPIIAIEDLTKSYRGLTAVSHLNLTIPRGSICGLLGPNGAGKTTTFKCLLGFARPTSGTIRIEGAPLNPGVFEHLAYVPEQSALYEWMTVAQHLELNRRSYAKYDDAHARELLALFRLDERKRVRRLSKGQHTALALVLAFSIRPSILVLDEPASGLDPIHQRHVLDLVIDVAANGGTVLFSSHQITQVERAADRVAIMCDGRLVVDDTVDALKGSEKVVEAIFNAELPSLNGLTDDPRIRRIDRSNRMLRAYVRTGAEEIAARVQAMGARTTSVLDLNLEDIFLNAVSSDRTERMKGSR